MHEIKSNNTPLIEQCPVENQYKLITYIWLGDQKTENVYVFGSFPGWDLSVNQLHGNSFINNLSIARTLNYLIYEKEIPSCIAVAIEPVDRLEELTYNDKMNTFLTEELLPWIQARYHVYQEKNHTTIAGLSLGGLAAFYAALQNPHVFGNVLSMSGSVHWKKDGYENQIPWIENQISSIDSNTSQPHFYIAAGELENKPLLTANRRLYKALKEKGYQITYEEFQGGHDGVW
ncbi:TPA: esterase family protein [Bacillus mycoides]|nr:esterase family protein [Bacillus mycoides]